MNKLLTKSRYLLPVAGLVVASGMLLSACTTYITPVRRVPGPGPAPQVLRHAWVPGHYDRFGGWVPGHYR